MSGGGKLMDLHRTKTETRGEADITYPASLRLAYNPMESPTKKHCPHVIAINNKNDSLEKSVRFAN